jgi:SAM-dependent methyltransferase
MLMKKNEKVDYYDKDFNFEEYLNELHRLGKVESLPEITRDEDAALLAESKLFLDPIHSISHKEEKSWNTFFSNHLTGQIYKPRRYITREFDKYLSTRSNAQEELSYNAIDGSLCLLEIGCGYGCTMFPILEKFSKHISYYIATDISEQALSILQTHPKYRDYCSENEDIATDVGNATVDGPLCPAEGKKQKNKIITIPWNIVNSFPFYSSSSPSSSFSGCYSPDIVLSIFTLSAVHPNQHVQCLQNIKRLLLSDNRHQQQLNDEHSSQKRKFDIRTSPADCSSSLREKETTELSRIDNCRGSSTSNYLVNTRSKYLLFRDYGVYDMTMFRHSKRHSEYLFERNDGTYCYYFELPYLHNLIESVGMKVVELSYATIINVNRKTKEKMYRVFVHGVFSIK